METSTEEKIKKLLNEEFPDLEFSESDIQECKQSLIYLGKAIFLYSLKTRSFND